MISQTLCEALELGLGSLPHLTVAPDPQLLDESEEHEACAITSPSGFRVGVTQDLEWEGEEPRPVWTLWATGPESVLFFHDFVQLVAHVGYHDREWHTDHPLNHETP